MSVFLNLHKDKDVDNIYNPHHRTLMSGTPRTDAAAFEFAVGYERDGSTRTEVFTEVAFAATLEQELNAAHAAITELNTRLQHQAQARAKALASEVADDVRITQELDRLRLANAELNARLEERAQDHIKASARDVAEIQRLRVELDALKRRTVKPLVWFHSLPYEQLLWSPSVNRSYHIVGRRILQIRNETGNEIIKEIPADSLDHAKRIAEDLHREAVLALLETEA